MKKSSHKTLRLNQTEVEAILWYHLRNRNFYQTKFRRQHKLQQYIVDFVCFDKKIIIELDGGQHDSQKQYDAIRTKNLKAQHFRVIRFWNHEIIENLEGVLETIYEALLG